MNICERSFKERRSFAQRVRDLHSVMEQHPDKVPIIVERFHGEKQLPHLDKSKFLVPSYVTFGELCRIIRQRMQLNQTQCFFLLINGKNLAPMSAQLGDIYHSEHDEDGFLYIVYASQEAFG